MDDRKDLPPEEPEEKPPVTYATPVMRAWAWVGVAYMLIVLATFTYYLATAEILIGIGPLLLIPALGGLAATAVLRCRQGQGSRLSAGLLAGACLVLTAWSLWAGIPALLRNFEG